MFKAMLIGNTAIRTTVEAPMIPKDMTGKLHPQRASSFDVKLHTLTLQVFFQTLESNVSRGSDDQNAQEPLNIFAKAFGLAKGK